MRPIRMDKYRVGDKVRFDITMLMEWDKNWDPDKEHTVTKITELESSHDFRGAGHTQILTLDVSPSGIPHFSGKWFVPVRSVEA